MLSADYRAAKAVMEARVEEATGRAVDVGHVQLPSQPALPDLAHRVLRRLALLLVATGGRLVSYALPPYRPAGVTMNGRTRNSYSV
jgi:hypothetical protein